LARKAHKETQALREAEQREKASAEQALRIAKQRIKQAGGSANEAARRQCAKEARAAAQAVACLEEQEAAETFSGASRCSNG